MCNNTQKVQQIFLMIDNNNICSSFIKIHIDINIIYFIIIGNNNKY